MKVRVVVVVVPVHGAGAHGTVVTAPRQVSRLKISFANKHDFTNRVYILTAFIFSRNSPRGLIIARAKHPASFLGRKFLRGNFKGRKILKNVFKKKVNDFVIKLLILFVITKIFELISANYFFLNISFKLHI